MSLTVCPLPDEPLGLLESLQREVLAIVEDDRVVFFSVGRTNSLPATKARHQTRIVPLLTTCCPRTILALEGALIRRLRSHPKNRNRAPHGGGRIAGGPYHLYVAVWRSSVPCHSGGALATASIGAVVAAGLVVLLAAHG